MMSSSATLSSSPFSSSSTFSSTKFKFKFPSFLQRSSLLTVESRAKPFTACSSTIHNTSASGQIRHCSLSRRRGLAFSATLPFLLPLHECVDNVGAKAVGLRQSEYLRIKEEISKVVTKGKAAGVLRLVFHDAGTFEIDENSGGMNGSIIYELERPENTGLKKSLKVLEKAKKEVDAIQSVSWADMVAVGGAEAISVCGGPKIPVALGRLDSATQELVALSGAHTLGSKGFGSPVAFDNSYFKILLEKPWKSSAGMSSMIGLPSDHVIVEDDECLRWITKYADNQNMFFEDFKNAYINL